MHAWPSCQLPEKTLRVQLPESSTAIQMENFLSLLESVDLSWLTPSSTTWAMDMIFAFVCGLGLFRLILPLLPLDSPSPPPAENTTTKKVVKSKTSKVRKKIRTVKERWSCPSTAQGDNDSYGAYRGSRKKIKEDKVLGLLRHSMQERLVNTISISQDLGQDASGEAFKQDATKAHLPPRQPTEESVATNSSLETSSAPRNEYLLLQDSKPWSPVLMKSSSIEPQSSVSASWPPETLTTGRHHSPPQQWAPSYPSHPLDPVTCPPPMPDPSMAAPEFEWKILATSQSTILQGLSAPMPTTPGLNLSRRPTSTTLGLNYYSSRSTSTSLDLDYLNRPTSVTPGLYHLNRPISPTPGLDHLNRPMSPTPGLDHLNRPMSTILGLDHLIRPTSTTQGLDHLYRPTSTTPGLDHLSRPSSTTQGLDHLIRPTSTTPGLDHLCRPTSTTPGLEHLSRPISGPFKYQLATKTLYHSNLTCDESFQEDLSLTIHKASFRTGPTDWQIESGEPSFIKHDMLEVQTSKRGVQLNVWKQKEKVRSDICWLHSWNSKQDNITSGLFWKKNCKSEQFSAQQMVLGNDLNETYNQLFWGHPILHSESLVATVSTAGAPLHRPSILFNGSPAYSPLQDQTNDPPQLYSPQPFLHHSVKSQPMFPKFSWSRSPPKTRLQTQARDPSPLSKLCDSAPIRDDGAPCPTPSGTQVIVPSSVEHLECHFLKKHRESMRGLPVIVKESQKAFNEHNSKSWVSQGQGSAVHLQGELISPELGQQMEKDFKKTFKQQQGQWPHKAQLSLDLDQAQLNHRTSCPSALANESIQHPQSISSNGPEICHPWRNLQQDLTKCLQRALKKPLYRSLEVFETISEPEEKTSDNRHPRSDVPNVSPVGPGKEELEGTLRNEWRETKDTFLPKGTYRVIYLDHESVPPKISKPTVDTQKKTSSTSKKTNNENFFVDPGIQKVLEGHMTRRLVRHRWRLPLRVLKTIRALNMKATTTLPFPRFSNASLPWESSDNSIIHKALGEPFQKDLEKEGTKTAPPVKSQSTQTCPSLLQVEFPREASPGNNSGPYEAPTTARRNIVTSVQEFSVPSQSSNSRGMRELVETEEEEPCDWIIPLAAGEFGNIEINEFLETNGSLSSPSESFSQESEVSGLSTPHSSIAGVGLQECSFGEFCRDWVPEVLLAAESLVSRVSQSSFTVASFKSKSSKPEEQKHSHISITNNKKYTSRKPREEDIKVKRTKSVQGHRSNSEKFGDKIKTFVQSILTPNYKEKETSRQKCKGLPPMTQSQPSVTGQLFMPVAEQVAEGQKLTTCVGQNLKKKLGVYNSSVPPNPVNRPGSHHRIPTESKKNQGNSIVCQPNLNLQSQPAQNKGILCGNIQTQVSSPYQHGSQVPHVSGMPVHCPRHCLYRNVLPRRQMLFPK